MPKLPTVQSRLSSSKITPEIEAASIAHYLAHRSYDGNGAALLGKLTREYFDENADAKSRFVEWYEARPGTPEVA